MIHRKLNENFFASLTTSTTLRGSKFLKNRGVLAIYTNHPGGINTKLSTKL